MSATTPVVAAVSGRTYNFEGSRVGRGVPQIGAVYKNKKICSCHREKTMVFCRACGYFCHGRVRLVCEIHPNVFFLQDMTQCAQCRSSVCLDEYFGSTPGGK